MSESTTTRYFVRIRGRSHGPLDLEKVRELARKGQLSRIHNVSDDGNHWRTAGEFPEIFENLRSPVGLPTSRSSRTTISDSLANEPSVWYYSQDDQPIGPVTISQLGQEIERLSLDEGALFWRDGMASWQPGSQLDELAQFFSSGSRSGSQGQLSHLRTGAGGAVNSPDTDLRELRISTLAVAANWSMFVAVSGYIYCGLWFILGIFLIALKPQFIPWGATSILMAAVVFTGALFLNQLSIGLRRAADGGTMADLNHGMKAESRFWMFAGLSVIIVTIMLVFLLIFFFNVIVQLVQDQTATASLLFSLGESLQ